MGAQQVKERTIGNNQNSALGVAGSSLRASRIKSRVPKDGRLIGSNIFTEHNGKYFSFQFRFQFNLLLCVLWCVCVCVCADCATILINFTLCRCTHTNNKKNRCLIILGLNLLIFY